MRASAWTSGDNSWFRRDIGDGAASVTVSRNRTGGWSWVVGTSTGVVKSGDGYSTANKAKLEADKFLATAYGVMAA